MTEYYGGTHLLIRFSDKIGNIDDTIIAHNNVVRKFGNVWFGKIGKALAYSRIEEINNQINDRTPSALMLIQKIEKKYKIYICRIEKIQRIPPPFEEIKQIPAYYETNSLTQYIRLWIKVSMLQEAPIEILHEFKVASSGCQAFESLLSSMAPMFRLKTMDFQELKMICRKVSVSI